MRLTCPNCGAQYAVDDRVIPETGRDVQCSNCGKTWFQHHPDHMPAPDVPAEEPAAATPPPPEPEPAPAPEPAPKPSLEQSAPAPAEEVPDPALGLASGDFDALAESDIPAEKAVPEAEEKEPDSAPATETAVPRRPVDEDVMGVLREEAAREKAAREVERGALESQGELDIAAPKAAGKPEPALARRDPARVMPSDTIPVEETQRSDRPAPRRERLPDVEEINSTLRPEEAAAARKAEDRVPRERRNRGRRIGLGISFFVFGCAALLYSQHQAVSRQLPQAAPMLDQYVASVDAARIQLDEALRASVERLQGTGE